MSDDPELLLKLGYQARREQRLDEAKQSFAEAVQISRTKNDRALLAQALNGLGQIERDMHDLDRALELYQEAVTVHRGLDDSLALAHTVRHVGDILRNRRQFDLAAPCYSEALAIYRSSDQTSPLDLANTLRGYALLKSEMGERDESRLLWHEAGLLYAAVDVQPGVDESQRQIALLSA